MKLGKTPMTRQAAGVLVSEPAAGTCPLSTAIEHFLYGDLGIQGVTRFAISQDVLRMALLPFEGPRVVTIATFHEARLNYVEASADDDDHELPRNVIGFDCEELFGSRWRFVLKCAVIEWCFESAWPAVERTGA